MSTDAASHPNELPCDYEDDVCGENLLHMCHTCEALFVHESTCGCYSEISPESAVGSAYKRIGVPVHIVLCAQPELQGQRKRTLSWGSRDRCISVAH